MPPKQIIAKKTITQIFTLFTKQALKYLVPCPKSNIFYALVTNSSLENFEEVYHLSEMQHQLAKIRLKLTSHHTLMEISEFSEIFDLFRALH